MEAPQSPGMLAQFASRVTRDSRRKQASLPSAVPEYKRHGDYLVHPDAESSQTRESHAAQGVNVTRFHRGFFRAREAGTSITEAHKARDVHRDAVEDERAQRRLEQWRHDRPYNILTGGGGETDSKEGREGVKLVPNAVNLTKEPTHRMRKGKFRFYDDTMTSTQTRDKVLEREGFSETHKESVVIGVPPAKPRLRLLSVGVRDNFAHTQLRTAGGPFDAVLNRNASQIVFG